MWKPRELGGWYVRELGPEMLRVLGELRDMHSRLRDRGHDLSQGPLMFPCARDRCAFGAEQFNCACREVVIGLCRVVEVRSLFCQLS